MNNVMEGHTEISGTQVSRLSRDHLLRLRRRAGCLGGLDPIPESNPLLQSASGVHLTFFGSFVFGTPGFPLSDVPLQQIAVDAADGRLDIKPARTFGFDEIRKSFEHRFCRNLVHHRIDMDVRTGAQCLNRQARPAGLDAAADRALSDAARRIHRLRSK
jgi:hypothetical protein